MKIKDLMTTEVKCCPEYATLNAAAQIMWENDIGGLPVVDNEGHVIGLITDRDICMSAYLQGVPLTSALVTSAMSKEVFSCRPDDDIAAAEKLMKEKQVHRLPVVDSAGHVIGVISFNDIARTTRETQSRKSCQISDTEIVETIVSVCAPRHRATTGEADDWPQIGLVERTAKWLARNTSEV